MGSSKRHFQKFAKGILVKSTKQRVSGLFGSCLNCFMFASCHVSTSQKNTKKKQDLLPKRLVLTWHQRQFLSFQPNLLRI